MPQFHALDTDVRKQINTLCSDIMDIQFVRNPDALKIDPRDGKCAVPLEKVYIGVKANSHWTRRVAL